MLYDPKWEIKADPFTLADFIGWLETKDPAGSYNFHNCRGECLAGLYMAEHGRDWNGETYIQTCRDLFGGSGYDVPVLIRPPHTFGAALKRARNLTAR